MLLEGTATLQQPLRVRRVAVDLTAILQRTSHKL
jgi:hypothetical protein